MKTHVPRKLLSLLLVLSMLLPLALPASAVSEGSTPLAAGQETQETTTEHAELDVAAVPEIIGAETAIERGHIERVYEDEGTDLNKLVFRNGDGSMTMYLYDYPVKYLDSDGNIQDISLNIADSPDASKPFRSESAGAVTAFSADLSGGIHLDGNGVSLRLIPQTGSSGSHGARRVDDKTVEYPYDERTTLEYSLTYTGFKEDIVVSEYTGQTEYSFTLYTNGLELTQIDGSYYLVDGDQTVRATVGDIIIFTADERNNAMGGLRAETVVEKEEYLLTIVLDPEYLSDPNTLYPIRIDPTLEVNYDEQGDGAIEDVTINSNAGSSFTSGSLFVGLRQTQGISRILMRFPGLDLSSLEGVQIDSATVELRDLLCEGTELKVYCYPYTGTDWSSGSSWSTLTQSWGAELSYQTITYDTGYSLSPKHRYSFDITAAVQGWLSGTYDQDKGIIFKVGSDAETGTTYDYRTLASYNRASNKPSLTVNYSYTGGAITSATGLNYVQEGGTLRLYTTMEGTVTWTSSNASIATVHSAGLVTDPQSDNVRSIGLVTGILAGYVTITASCEGYTDKTFTLWVTVPDGVYYIANASSGKCLKNTGGDVALATQNTGVSTRISQLWKITHVRNGLYAVRPLGDTSVALTVPSSTYIGVDDAAASDTALNENYLWKICHNSFGYYFQQAGAANKTITWQTNGTTTIVYPGTWTSNMVCHWNLESANGIFLRDTETLKAVTSSTVKYILQGDSLKYTGLGINYEYYGSLIGGITWTSNNSSVAGMSSDGEVTGKTLGETVITIHANINGSEHSQSFTLVVSENQSSDPFYRDNIQYIRYTRITGKNWWGLGSETDHTISIIKSSLLSNDYCIVLDNINGGYYRCLCISEDLKDTLNSLEDGYQAHYSIIPLFNTTTTQEKAAHAAMLETDQMVDEGYFSTGSSEYFGAWAFNYTSELNLLDKWMGVIDTATAAFQVYLTLTTVYYSYLASTSTITTNVSSTQYSTTASYLDDIDDALGTTGYTNRSVISAEARNEALGLEYPPYQSGTPVIGYETTQTTQYVRVYAQENNNIVGHWMMKYSDIEGLTASEIQQKFALKNPPTHYCFVDVPSGIQMYTGIVAPIEAWGVSGGGIQYEVIGEIFASWFGNGIPLP